MQSLYIHIPFCNRKCFYCSFVVSIGQEQRIDSYLECLKKEASPYKGKEIISIYIGGGTPTFMNEEQLENIFTFIKEHFNVCHCVEWTVEANPEALSFKKVKLLKELGVNRISLGIQSLNNQYLKYLGRNHDVHTAIEAYSIVRDAGFRNVSLDLMYSFPKQRDEEIVQDVKAIAQLGAEHISLYALDLEQNSRFYTQKIILDHHEDRGRHYLLAQQNLEQEGYQQYEVSNFAKGNCQSRHNRHYWLGGNYIGLGVGAHSHDNGRRFWNIDNLFEYIKYVEKGNSVIANEENLKPFDRMLECFLFGLRMNEGVSLDDLQKQFDCRLDKERNGLIEELIQEKLLYREESRIKTTEKGRLVLDELSARLI